MLLPIDVYHKALNKIRTILLLNGNLINCLCSKLKKHIQKSGDVGYFGCDAEFRSKACRLDCCINPRYEFADLSRRHCCQRHHVCLVSLQ